MATASVSLLLTQSCSSSKETNSSPGSSPVKYSSRYLKPVIDGKMNDWGDSLSFDNTTKCIYSIANDETALYIAVKAIDRMQQMKIINGGMEIWLDSKMKKTKSLGVKFPIGGVVMTMPGTGNRGAQADPKEIQKQARNQMLRMELTGFKDGFNGLQSVYSDVQVKPVIEWNDKEELIYELAIPFATLDETTAANLNNISIGIVINGLKLPDMSGGMPAGGPPGGGGGGMRPPGGGGGGMRPSGGGSMPDMESMSKETSSWTKYSIAKK